MTLSISVRSADDETPQLVFDVPRVVIGRGSGSEVRLPDPSVSQRHASIRQRGRDYIVLDEGSTNGTFVGPVRLPPGTPRVLHSGDLIRVGRVWLEIRIDATASPTATQLTKELALRLVAGALDSEGQPSAPSVLVSGGPDQGRELVLKEFQHAYVLGRNPSCELSVSDNDASRRHLEFKRVGADVVVRDLGSKNGTWLGDALLDGSARWQPGTELRFGETVLELRDPLKETLDEIDGSPDEVLDEPIDMPESPSPSAVAREAALPSGSEQPLEFPVAARPARSVSPHRAPRGSSWSVVDVLVAGVAVVVLGLSIAGVLWLMRS